MKKLAAAVLALFFLAGYAQASTDSALKQYWTDMGGAINITPAGKGQTAGYYSGGGAFLRTPVRNSQLASITLPSLRAGCGGIDAFAGAFSHINAGEFVAMLKGIANNASGFAFQIGLEVLCPVCKQVMSELQSIADQVNQMNINSCQAAQGLVGGLWPASDTADKAICDAIGNSQGFFSDMAASRHGCGDQGLRASTEAAAKGTPLYDQIPQNINLTWKALTQNSWINGDTDMMQFMQTVIGTIVVTKAQDDNTPGGYNYVPARAIDSDTLTALMQGGNVTIYTCAADATGDTTTNCLNVQQNNTSTITISAAAGFNARVTTSLDNLINDIVNRTALSAADNAFLNLTSIPIHKILMVETAYNPAVAQADVDNFSQLIAIDVLYTFLETEIRSVLSSASKTKVADKQLVQNWNDNVYRTLAEVSKKRVETEQRAQQVINLVERSQFIEKQLMSRLGNGLAQNVSFGRTHR